MKLQAQNYELESSGADLAEEFGMETTDPAVIQIMLENIYPDPYVWPRELLANWFDAGGGGSLTLPESIDPLWVIEDHGEGMDHEFMMKRYTKIFASNKRDSNDAIGGFGHGRLSPLAYTDTYNVRSRFMHEGAVWEGNYVVFKGENKIPKILNTSLALSEVQQTGVTVTIPIGTQDINKIVSRTRFFASYLPTPPEGTKKIEYRHMNSYGGHREDDNNEMQGVRLILGGVPYPAPRELRFNPASIDLFFALGELQPTLARDAVNADEATLEKIRERMANFGAEYTDHINKELAKESSVFDRYSAWLNIVNNIPYGIRQYMKIENAQARLSGEEIFTKVKGNFNLHTITSDINNHRYDGMTVADASLKSLKGLQIKRLVSTGDIRRNEGDETGRDTGIDFEYYIRRGSYHNNHNKQNLMIFAIKAPYATGQIKLIKEAMAAKLGEEREKGNFSKEAYILLIQYDDEKTAKDLAALISPKFDVNIITDTSNRVQANPYVSVMYHEVGSRGWPKTKALRVSQLNNKDYVFYVRKEKERADSVKNLFSQLSDLEGKPFEGKTLIGLQPSDAKYLPKNYRQALAVTIAYFRKTFKYKYDTKAISAEINAINARKRKQSSVGILVAREKAPSGYASTNGKRLIDALVLSEKLKDRTDIHELKSLLDNDSSQVLDQLYAINSSIRDIDNLIALGFMKEDMLTGDQPIPTSKEIDLSKVEAFYNRYPLLRMIESEYNLRNYGYGPELVPAVIPYIENN
jgi:hypothetical protein